MSMYAAATHSISSISLLSPRRYAFAGLSPDATRYGRHFLHAAFALLLAAVVFSLLLPFAEWRIITTQQNNRIQNSPCITGQNRLAPPLISPFRRQPTRFRCMLAERYDVFFFDGAATRCRACFCAAATPDFLRCCERQMP